MEVLSVSREKSELLFGSAIDSPVSGKRFSENLITIKGWVLGKSSKAFTVRAVFDDEVLQQSLINVYRADVAKVYPLASNEYGGFSIGVEVTRMDPQGKLQVQAVLEDGSCVIIGAFELQIQLIN